MLLCQRQQGQQAEELGPLSGSSAWVAHPPCSVSASKTALGTSIISNDT